MKILSKLLLIPLLFAASTFPLAANDIPNISADAGPCSVDFTVQDGSHKPIYDAKIKVLVRYGFMSLRKIELEIGTNNDGKARLEGLPSRSKKPMEFRISHGQQTKTIEYDPSARCNANYTVTLDSN
jgi:hypothetical protein